MRYAPLVSEEPARTLEQAAFGVHLDPFELVRPGHAWYTNLDAQLPAVHYGVTTRLESLFRQRQGKDRHLHVAFVGHGGTGKSTLIRQAMKDLQGQGILPIYVNARESFDQVDMAFADVVLVLAEAVVSTLVEEGQTLELDPRYLALVRDWFSEHLVSEERRIGLFGEIDGEAGAQLDLPLIARFAARIKGTLRSSNEYREEIRRRGGRDPEALIRGANALLDAVHEALAQRKQQLCVVFDNLEKIHDRHQVDAAVLRRADDLRRLRCHVVYFLSPADQYAPAGQQISQLFPAVEVPVIPVRIDPDAPEDEVDVPALAVVESLLGKRIALDSLLSEPDRCVAALARWSRGRLRDVVELTRQACEFAHFDSVADQVELRHVEAAARKLAAQRLVVMRPSCWARAVEIHRDKQVDNREEDALMLSHSLVLAYDGRPWWDVHPFVRADARFSRAARDGS